MKYEPNPCFRKLSYRKSFCHCTGEFFWMMRGSISWQPNHQKPPNCGRRVGAMAMTAAMGRAGPNARGPGFWSLRGLRAPGLGRCKAQGLGVSRVWGPPMDWNWALDSRQIQIINTRFLNVSQVQPLESYDIYIEQRWKQRSAKCQDKNSRNSCCNGSPMIPHSLPYLDFSPRLPDTRPWRVNLSAIRLALGPSKIRPRDAIRGCMLLGSDGEILHKRKGFLHWLKVGLKLMFMLKSTIYEYLWWIWFQYASMFLKPQLSEEVAVPVSQRQALDRCLARPSKGGLLGHLFPMSSPCFSIQSPLAPGFSIVGSIQPHYILVWLVYRMKSSRIGCIVLYPILSRYQMISHLVVAYIGIII